VAASRENTKSTLAAVPKHEVQIGLGKIEADETVGHCALEEQDEALPVAAVFAHGNQAAPMGNGGLARVEKVEHQPSKLEIKS
jgi:hypothetical protein